MKYLINKTKQHRILICTLLVGLCLMISSAAPRLQIQSQENRIRLDWNSMPNINYEVQTASNLITGSWSTVESVLAGDSLTEWNDPTESTSKGFYRLVVPAARIFGFEPGFVNTNGGETAYVTGQNFDSDTKLRIDGVVYGATVQSSLLMQVALPPLSPGPHLIELVDGATGQVLDTLSNAFTVVTGLAETLMPPPEPPPARPIGYSRYMAPEVVLATKSRVPPCEKFCPNTVQMKAGSTGRGSHLFSGEFYMATDDLGIPGLGFDFVWRRTYRSRTGEDTPQGVNWDHSYNVRLEQSGIDTVVLRSGLARRDTFYLQADGSFANDGFFTSIADLNGDGSLDVAFADTGRWLLHPLDGTPQAGRLTESIDRNGNTMSFAYDNLGRLTNIVDTLNRSINVNYNADGRLVSVTDFAGRSVTYEYYGLGELGGSQGDLKSVTTPTVTGTPNTNDFPLGKTTVYSYTTTQSTGQTDVRALHKLISITDPKGQNPLQIDYATSGDPENWDFGGAVSLRRGIEKSDIRRGVLVPAPSNRYATVRTIVNDWVGNVSEYDHDSRNRLVAVRRFTGRAQANLPTTDVSNRPVNPLRSYDPVYYEITYLWNRDSLLTEITYPAGNLEQFVYERDVTPDAPRVSAGNLRIRRMLPGPRGADQQELTEAYDRHPDFAGDPTASQGAGSRKFKAGAALAKAVNIADSGGDDWTTDDWDGDEFYDFVTAFTDSNHNTTRFEYDSSGNRTSTMAPDEGGGEHVVSWGTNGRMASHVHPADGNGRHRRDEFSYYTSGSQRGHLRTVTLDVGDEAVGDAGLRLVTSYEYDSVGNLTRTVDPRGNDELWVYNELDQIVRHLSPPLGTGMGTRVSNELWYDGNDNLVLSRTENRDETGALGSPPFFDTQFIYDGLDGLTQLVDVVDGGLSITNEYEYDGNRNRVLVRSPEAVEGTDPTNVVVLVYDERDLLFQRSRAPGSALQTTDLFDYDPNGNPVARVEDLERPDGATETQFEYDGYDRLVSRADAMGNRQERAYDANGNLLLLEQYGELHDVSPGSASNVLFTQTRYAYDGLDRQVRQVDSFFDIETGVPIGDGEVETRRVFAPNSTLIEVWDDLGRATLSDWDPVVRDIRTTDPLGNVIEREYDASGNVTNITRTNVSSTGGPDEVYIESFRYDDLDRAVGHALWALNSTGTRFSTTNSFHYDSRDNLVREVDPRGNTTLYDYDGLNRRTRVSRQEGNTATGTVVNVTHHEYDANSRCTAVIDGNSNTTRYVYDSLDRRTRREEADGVVHSYEWDSARDLGAQTDGNGTRTTYSYDYSHRLTRGRSLPGPGISTNMSDVTYTYDGLSRIVLTGNDAPIVRRAHDSMGNLVSESLNGRQSLYTYDSLGDRLSVTTPGGGEASYSYNPLNRPALITYTPSNQPSILVESIFYSGTRVTQRQRGNGLDTTISYGGNLNGAPSAAGDFNTGLPSSIHHGRVNPPLTIDERLYAYDPNQNLTDRTVILGVVPQTAGIYAFDIMDRIVQATITTNGTLLRDTTYVYDAVGNRLSITDGPETGPYVMDSKLPEPADQQMNQYTTTPQDGRQYDRNGNLVARNTATVQWRYLYDSSDRLVAVSNATSRALVATFDYDAFGRRISQFDAKTGMRRDYVYDGHRVIEEYTNGVPERRHIGTVGGNYSGILGYTFVNASGSFWHHSSLDGVVALSDSGGNVIERYEYDEFGRTSILTSNGQLRASSSVGNLYMFGGMRRDEVTGFYMPRHCDDPAVGYCTSSAPLYDPLIGRVTGRRQHGKVVVRGWNPTDKRSLRSIGVEDCDDGNVIVRGRNPPELVSVQLDGSRYYDNDNGIVRGRDPTVKKTLGQIWYPDCDDDGGIAFPVDGSALMGNGRDDDCDDRNLRSVGDKTNKSDAARARRRRVVVLQSNPRVSRVRWDPGEYSPSSRGHRVTGFPGASVDTTCVAGPGASWTVGSSNAFASPTGLGGGSFPGFQTMSP